MLALRGATGCAEAVRRRGGGRAALGVEMIRALGCCVDGGATARERSLPDGVKYSRASPCWGCSMSRDAGAGMRTELDRSGWRRSHGQL